MKRVKTHNGQYGVTENVLEIMKKKGIYDLSEVSTVDMVFVNLMDMRHEDQHVICTLINLAQDLGVSVDDILGLEDQNPKVVNNTQVTILPDGRMDTVNASKYLGFATKTLSMHRVNGTGPRYVKRGKIFYYKADLDAWLAAGNVDEDCVQVKGDDHGHN